MPPIEVTAFRDELVAAARRQPIQGADIGRSQADAVRNLVGTIRIVLAAAGHPIEQLAADMGEVDVAGALFLELVQAAAAAAVAQALPFGPRHLFQRLGFPEESFLA